MGEGGAMFLLERADQARRRSAHAYGELAGHGGTSDAFNLVIPNSDPAPAARAVRWPWRTPRLNADQIDYVNAHGTSTPVGDCCEAKVLQSVLGSSWNSVPVSSTKSMTGHLLSAAAAFEALACLVALDRGAVPPTINLGRSRPRMRSVPCRPIRPARNTIRVAISNSFGFGGNNTCAVFRKVA